MTALELTISLHPSIVKRKYIKETILTILFCTPTLTVQAQTSLTDYLTRHQPKYETRAVWLTTLSNLDWPKTYAKSEAGISRQKQELIDILDSYQRANINTVLLQTRVRAATIYPSAIEPWDRCITGTEGGAPGFGYDPLAFAVEECHRRGMELHAWIATIPAGAKNSLGCRLLRQKGFRIRNYKTGSYLDPADPNVPAYLAAICAEIVKKYEVDGINLDYIRYPDGWPRPTYRNGDSPDDRRSNITAIVRAIHDEVKAVKPWVKISCSPVGKYSDLSRYSSKNFNARDRVAQEAQEWLRTGLMDQLYPMQYFRGENYYPFIADWMENAHGREVVTGLGTYFLDPREGNWTLDDMTRQMYVSRDAGMGHAHFRSYFLTSNKQGIYDFEQQFNATPALPPAIQGGKSVAPPTLPAHTPLIQRLENGSVSMNWEGTSPYYNIYASRSFPVDIRNARNLVSGRYTGRSLHLRQVDPALHFAITAMNRYGKESDPLQETVTFREQASPSLLPNDGTTLVLPIRTRQADIIRYEIRTMQGQPFRSIKATSRNGMQISIMTIPDGIYFLRGCTQKNRSYMLGAFIIRRK
ncbi:MAG: family 10 glycosylhydrolase [Prevotella denticola]